MIPFCTNMILHRTGLILFAIITIFSLPALADDPLIDITVNKGDSCASIARRLYTDPKYVDLIHSHNDMGPPPHHLVEGTVLHVPPKVPANLVIPDARVSFVRNHVEGRLDAENAAVYAPSVSIRAQDGVSGFRSGPDINLYLGALTSLNISKV